MSFVAHAQSWHIKTGRLKSRGQTIARLIRTSFQNEPIEVIFPILGLYKIDDYYGEEPIRDRLLLDLDECQLEEASAVTECGSATGATVIARTLFI